MSSRTLAHGVLVIGALTLASQASADVIWNEAVNGDLSGNRLVPTNLLLQLGVNSVIASTKSGDVEYLHLTLPAGSSLNIITHFSWQSTDQLGFCAVQAGTTFTEPAIGTNVANLLGYSHFGTATVGQDILPLLATGAGAIGFTPPLFGSDYTFWFNQTNPFNPATYQLDFVVVPGPGLAAFALIAPLSLRRRRAQSN